MSGEDVRTVFLLLEQFWPNAKLIREPLRQKAWGTVLERYPLEAVRDQIFVLAATSKYLPDLADITGPLTAPPPSKTDGTKPQPGPPGAADRRARENMERMRQLWRDGKL